MFDTGDESAQLTMVFLPAMLCDEELYCPQIEGLRDQVPHDSEPEAGPGRAVGPIPIDFSA
jgi:hypothetical protein